MMELNRREMLKVAGAGALLLALPTIASAAEDKPFTLPGLPYAFDALEPHIDARTMEIHHGRHHQAYVDNLNKAVAGTDWAGKSIQTILMNLARVPDAKRLAIRNNGGGHYNHSLFWRMLSPSGGKPGPALETAIKTAFGETDKMLAELKQAAMGRFGSGWAWLQSDPSGKLSITSTPNQDNPLMDASGSPILGIDVWEHAYYLKYQNKRADYVDALYKVINWEYVSTRYEEAKKG